MRLADKTVLVTGSSGGIGRAIVQAFADEGAAVLAVDLIEAGAGETEAVGEIRAFAADVSRSDDCREAVQCAVEWGGGLDILVNNAGISRPGRLHDPESFEIVGEVMATNLLGPFLMMQWGLPHMMNSGGSIINVSSIGAELVNPAVHPSYAASKGGLNSLTRYVGAAYGKYGIRCNAIAPGAVATPLWDSLPPDVRQIYADLHPIGIGQPMDVARLAVFLATDGAWINGTVITMDGGNSAAGGLARYAAEFI